MSGKKAAQIMLTIRRGLLLLFVTLLSVCSFSRDIPVRSSRNVTASVIETADGKNFTVSVKFLPVVTLTTTANERLTIALAKGFADRAISGYLNAEKSIDFLKSRTIKADAQDVGTSGRALANFEFSVPRAALRDVNAVKADLRSDEARKAYDALHESFGADAETAFDDFRSSVNRDIRTAEAAFLYEIEADETRSEQLKNEIITAFATMIAGVEKDDMLLMSEKTVIIRKITDVRAFLIDKLEKTPSGKESSGENSDLVSGAYFRDTEYRPIIMSDPILLQTGGCRAFKTNGGTTYLVAVGMAQVRNDSARDRIRRKDIADGRARAEIAKHQETEVRYFSTRRTSEKISFENLEESSSAEEIVNTCSTMDAAAYLENMEQVAFWYSKDGKAFFLALGCKVEKEKKSK